MLNLASGTVLSKTIDPYIDEDVNAFGKHVSVSSMASKLQAYEKSIKERQSAADRQNPQQDH